MAYSDWRIERDLRVVSIESLEKELNALNIFGNRQNLFGIDSIYWQGIKLPKYYYFISDPANQ